MAPKPDIRRILVALSGFEDERAYLDAAIDLAGRMQAELATLFIEDANLLRASMLPGMREIGRTSAQSRQLELAGLERSLKQAAAVAEQRLRQSAERRELRYSFRVVRGNPLPQLLDLAERLDAVLLSPVAWGRQRFSRNRPIVVAYDATVEADRALAMAAGLARGSGSSLHVLIPAADEASYRRHLTQAQQHAAGLVLIGERVDSAMALAERVNCLGASLLVLHAQDGFDAAALNRLRRNVCCDLLLLR